MVSAFPNCWEIKNCGRQKGGLLVAELCECIASLKGLGHSCWAIAGTLCGGIVQGTTAQKEGTCLRCLVYTDYNRMSGIRGQDVRQAFPDEEEKHREVLKYQLQRIHDDHQEKTARISRSPRLSRRADLRLTPHALTVNGEAAQPRRHQRDQSCGFDPRQSNKTEIG